MKKIRAIVTISGLCLLAAAGIWALGTNRGNGSAGVRLSGSGNTSAGTADASSGRTSFYGSGTTVQEQPKILIAYFTWADNTTVTDSDAAVAGALRHYQAMGDAGRYSETDAVSSACSRKIKNHIGLLLTIGYYRIK